MPFIQPATASQAGPGGTAPPTDTAPSGLPPSIGVPGLGPAKSAIMPHPEVPGNGPNGRVVVAGGPAPFGLPASFGVSSNTGVMTYTVPIDVPPGVAGMQPKLSLQYNSSGGNGPLGIGWSLAGLDAITRCPQTIATNGVAGGVNDDGNDRYCLDGQQLIAVPGPGQSAAGAYGANATYYAKEIDDFSEIISYGSTSSFPTPSYFIVHTKSGLTLEFGNTTTSPGSQVVSASGNVVETWSLDKVTDQQSNYMVISYSNATGDGSQGVNYPIEILYGGNRVAGTSAINSVVFGWQSRTDTPVLYAAGTPHRMIDRLTTITTYVGSTAVFQYVMPYTYGSSTQRSEMASISKGNLPGLVFSYTNAQLDSQPDLLTSISNSFGAKTNITYLPATSPTVDSIGLNVGGEGAEISSTAPSSSVVSQVQQVVNAFGYTGVNLTWGADTYTTNYHFASPEIDLYGRGNLGFVNSSIADLQTGLSFSEIFYHIFPLIDDPGWVMELLPGGGVPSGCEDCFQNSYYWVTSAQGTTFPYMSQSVETRNDIKPGANYGSPVVSGALPKITNTYTYDSSGPSGRSWGNLVQATATTSDGYSDQQTMSYQSLVNTANWLPGLVTSFSDSAYGLNQSAAQAQTRTTNFAYANASNCTAPNEICSVVTQQGGGNNIQSTVSYTYDNFGNVLSETISGSDLNGANPTTSVTYDGQGQFPTSLTNALGQTEHFSTDARFGFMTSITDINDQTTSFQYNPYAELTQKSNPDGTYTSYSYLYTSAQSAMNVQQQFFASDGKTQVAPEVIKYYDGIGRDVYDDVQVYGDCSANSYFVRTAHIYDANGNLAQVTNPYCYGAQPVFTTNTSDELGRVVQAVEPNGAVDTTQYEGQTTVATNGLGQTGTVYKDGHDNVTWSQDVQGHKMNFVYDGFDQRTSMTDPGGNVTSYVYDILGRQVSGVDPDKGAWTASYNSLGELVGTTDAVGNATTMTYDLVGRMLTRTQPGQADAWTYDPTNGIGELATSTSTNTNTNALIQYRVQVYDSLGRETNTGYQTTASHMPFSGAVGYNPNTGQIASVNYPSGDFSIAYNYSPIGTVSSVTANSFNPSANAWTSQTIWTLNSSNPNGQVTKATYGNGVVVNNTYDTNTNLLTAIQAGLGGSGTSVANFGYSYDILGNLTARNDYIEQGSDSFGYDNLNRLTNITTTYYNGGGNYGPPMHKTVSYDALGNITSRSEIGTYTYGGAGPHQVQSIAGGSATGFTSTNYSYDANGNVITGDGYTAQWTSFNMASSVQQMLGAISTTNGFTYNAEHNRVSETESSNGGQANSIYYAFDPVTGQEADLNINARGTGWTDYVKIGGQLVMMHNMTSSNIYGWNDYFIQDNLGSIAVVVQDTPSGCSGTALGVPNSCVLERDSYDAWGDRRNSNGTDMSIAQNNCNISITSKAYTSQEQLQGVCLLNYNARMYDPLVGKFLSVDPAVANWADPQSWNAYAYARNNPLRYTDPTGMTDAQAGLTVAQAQVVANGGTVDENGITVSGANGTVTATSDATGDAVSSIPISGGGNVNITYNAGDSTSVSVTPGGSSDSGGIQNASTTSSGNASTGGSAPNNTGKAGETSVKSQYDIGDKAKIKINGRVRIPDGIIPKVSLSEIKNVAKLSFTRQLRDFADYAAKEGLRFDLYVKEGTVLSRTLSDAVSKGIVNLRTIPSVPPGLPVGPPVPFFYLPPGEEYQLTGHGGAI